MAADPLGLTGGANWLQDPVPGDLYDPDMDDLENRLALIVEGYPEDLKGAVTDLGATFAKAVLDLDDNRPDRALQALHERYPSINEYIDDELLVKASREGLVEHDAVETLLKGKEIELPHGHRFFDKDGHARHEIRIRWFDGDARTYHEAYLGPEKARSHIPGDPIGADHLLQYSHDDPPVFVGHYWLDTDPGILAPNIACLDYSVAAPDGGKLVAYRWEGEQRLSNDKFVYVQR